MSASTVCFGYKTAFQIVRAIGPIARTAPHETTRVLPPQPPSSKEVRQRIELLESTYPGMLIARPAHVLAADASLRRTSSSCTSHVCSAHLRGKPLVNLGNRTYISTAALTFALAAAREPNKVCLLELGYELCGSYQTWRTGVPTAYQVDPLTCTKALRAFVSRNPSLRGSGKIEAILPYLADGSASPRETKQALVFGLPMMYGGYGLGIPRMNFEVEASAAARALTGKSSFRCDLCWPEAKLDVEYQSRENHSGEEKRISDSRRTNALIAMGWTVIGITNDELDSLAATDAIAEAIRKQLGKSSHVRVSNYHAKKLKLRRQLGLPLEYE